jgi:hypothetical protein
MLTGAIELTGVAAVTGCFFIMVYHSLVQKHLTF